ncbi:alpha/beta hydrolase [Alloscardovia criceti]|uniref:alpha/beta hydrolase n=1 Tax=Alloscardovia criceti TaxID=356828 RepID=UPI00037CC553|nr:alpha/beta hydrolase [Alloscardovia criceti]
MDMSSTQNPMEGPGFSDNSSASAIIEQAKTLGNWKEAGHLWSYIDEDLQAEGAEHVSLIARKAAVLMRSECCKVDFPRIISWQLPEDVVAHLAIPYIEDNNRAHYLDVFAPADANAERLYPVVIDDHGGGFVYGLRELNRSFAMHLAHRGFVVVVPSYRPGPRHNFAEMLTDLSQAYAWTKENIASFGGDTSKLFLTGDSAGGCMALYSSQIENSVEMSEKTGVPQAGIDIKGLLLVCGVYDLTACMSTKPTGNVLDGFKKEIFQTVREGFEQYSKTDNVLAAAPLPPVFINTAEDDFLHDENVQLAERLEKLGVECELDDARTSESGELGHVYVVGLATHPRSQETLDKMAAFMTRVITETD